MRSKILLVDSKDTCRVDCKTTKNLLGYLLPVRGKKERGGWTHEGQAQIFFSSSIDSEDAGAGHALHAGGEAPVQPPRPCSQDSPTAISLHQIWRNATVLPHKYAQLWGASLALFQRLQTAPIGRQRASTRRTDGLTSTNTSLVMPQLSRHCCSLCVYGRASESIP